MKMHTGIIKRAGKIKILVQTIINIMHGSDEILRIYGIFLSVEKP